jgi:hypothetical protein
VAIRNRRIGQICVYLIGVGSQVSGAEGLALPVQVLVVVLGPGLPEEVLERAAGDELDDDEDRVWKKDFRR